MGQTSRGIVYPSNYSAVADVPADLQIMAQSIDDILQEDEQNIQNNSDDIATIQENVSAHEQSIQDNTTDINTLKNQVQSFALISETGNKVEIEINSLTYVMKIILKDKNNNVINTSNEIDLPLETMVVGARYDSTTKELVLTLKNGQETRFSIADLIDGLVSQSDFDDLVEIVETNTETIANNTIAIANNVNDIKQNEDNIDAINNLIDTEFDTNTAEGTTIDVEDSAEWDGSILIGGNTEQKQLSGKNKLDSSKIEQTTKNGITCSYDENTQEITFNGTCTANNTVFAFKGDQIPIIQNVTKLIAYYSSGSVSGSCDLRCFDSAYEKQVLTSLLQLQNNRIIAVTSSHEFIAANKSIRFNNGAVCDNFKFKVMISDDNNTDFEEYCGGQPSPNPDYPQEIKVVKGDNIIEHVDIFNDGKFEIGSYNDLSFQARVRFTNSKIPIGTPIIIETNFDLSVYKWAVYESTQPLPTSQQISTNTGGWHSDTNIIKYTTANQYVNLNIARIDDRKITKDEISKFRCIMYTRKAQYRLDLGGKNIFNKDVETKQAYPKTVIGDSISYTNSNATTTYAKCCFLEKGKTYTLSWKQEKEPVSTNDRVGCLIDENDTILSTFNSWKNGVTSRVITPSVSGYMILPVDNNTTDIQIEEGTIATEYSRYMQNPIELCKIGAFEDVLFKNVAKGKYYNEELEEGAWYKKEKIEKNILNSKLNFEKSAKTTVNRYYIKEFITQKYNRKSANLISNCLKAITPEASDSNAIGIAMLNQDGIMINFSINDEKFDSLEKFNEWIDGQKVVLYYVLGEEKNTKITDPTLISQLEKLLKVQMYHGVNHFYVETDNLEPNMELTYKQSNKIKNEKQNARLDNIESRLALLE